MLSLKKIFYGRLEQTLNPSDVWKRFCCVNSFIASLAADGLAKSSPQGLRICKHIGPPQVRHPNCSLLLPEVEMVRTLAVASWVKWFENTQPGVKKKKKKKKLNRFSDGAQYTYKIACPCCTWHCKDLDTWQLEGWCKVCWSFLKSASAFPVSPEKKRRRKKEVNTQVRLQNEQHQQGQTVFSGSFCGCCRSCAGFKQRCSQCCLSCYPFTQPRTNKVCSALLNCHPSCWNVKSHHPEKTLHRCQVALVLVLDSSTWLADSFTIPMGWFVWQ